MFIDWTASTTEAVFEYAGGVITDLMPLLTVVVGVGLGLIIISAIISAIRNH